MPMPVWQITAPSVSYTGKPCNSVWRMLLVQVRQAFTSISIAAKTAITWQKRSCGPPRDGPIARQALPARQASPSPRVRPNPRSRNASCRCRSEDLDQSHTLSNRSEEHTSELQSQSNLVCRLLLEKKKIRGQVAHATDHELCIRRAVVAAVARD